MSSTLSEMSLEDLWELFPIFLEPHQAVWKEWYEEETSLLMGILPHRERMRIRVFHLHLRYIGDHDELYFRDYLIENPDIAHEYERLKLRLWKEFEHDRDSYTDSKSDFVAKYTQIAKEKYDEW